MDSTPAEDNVLPIDRSPPEREPTELELARRLVELLEERQLDIEEREAAEARAQDLRKREDELNEEIVAIKRTLGGSVKRGRGSRPTSAASSRPSRTLLNGRVMEALAEAAKGGEELSPRDLSKRLGLTDPAEKQAMRNRLLYLSQQGVLTRRAIGTGRGQSGHAYRLAN